MVAPVSAYRSAAHIASIAPRRADGELARMSSLSVAQDHLSSTSPGLDGEMNAGFPCRWRGTGHPRSVGAACHHGASAHPGAVLLETTSTTARAGENDYDEPTSSGTLLPFRLRPGARPAQRLCNAPQPRFDPLAFLAKRSENTWARSTLRAHGGRVSTSTAHRGTTPHRCGACWIGYATGPNWAASPSNVQGLDRRVPERRLIAELERMRDAGNACGPGAHEPRVL